MKKFIAIFLILALFVTPAFSFECEYENPEITLFDLSAALKGNVFVQTIENVFKGYADEKGNIITVLFASVSGDTSKITEVGYEIDGKFYKLAEEKFAHFLNNKMFGIGYLDPNGILPEFYTAVPYVISNGKVIKGESREMDRNSELTGGYPKWSERENVYTLQGTEWRFYPEDNYISHQNPPDFSWPYVEKASCYDLIISKNRDFDEIYASAFALLKNYYNFGYTFDKDVYYYKVRFHSEGNASEWSEIRKFSIASDAVDFPVDDIDTLLSKIPESHPRIAVNPKTESFMKTQAKTSGHIEEINQRVLEYLKTGKVQEEPATAEEFFDAGNNANSQLTDSAIIYYLLENEEAGAYAKKALLSICEWNIYGTSSYVAHDLKFRDMVQSMAFTYSYIRDLLNDAEREKVLSVIKERALILETPTEGIMDAISHLKFSPYMSHGGSAVESLLEVALCTYGDLPEAERWLRDYLPLYINYFPNWGREDGGWSQGTGYGQYTLTKENLRFTLMINDMVNMYNKPFFRNYYKNLIYTVGFKSGGGALFGDQSDGLYNSTWSLAASNIARTIGSRYASWFYENRGTGRTGAYSRFYMDYLRMPSSLGVANLPESHYFKDVGLVAMLSELENESRTATYFKSSSYGSHNHSHADQNTFTISKNGKNLAIDSGYYDAYGSNHYNNYYELTYAHNGITYDNGKGQTGYAMCANGNIEGYLNSDELTLAIGNAKNAYNFVYNLATKGYIEKQIFDKMKRYFIYVKPGNYVVIDDIAFSNEKTGTLEWWLNSFDFSSLNEEIGKAVIDNGTDALDVKMHYPDNMTLNHYEGFVAPDGTAIPLSGSYADLLQSDRINFRTAEVNSSKIIATMQLRESDESESDVISLETDEYIKLLFEDGTEVFVNKTDSEFEAEGYLTDAAVLVIKNGKIMIADGTFLDKDDRNLVDSDKTVSVYLGYNEIDLFANEPASISLAGYYSEIYRDELNNYHTGYPRDGITWEKTNNGVKFNIEKGGYKATF